MNPFQEMNIFFTISTIGFVILGILLCVVVYYVIQLLRTLNQIATTVEEEAQAFKEDLDEARASVKRGGVGLLSLFGFASKTGARLMKKKRARSQ